MGVELAEGLSCLQSNGDKKETEKSWGLEEGGHGEVGKKGPGRALGLARGARPVQGEDGEKRVDGREGTASTWAETHARSDATAPPTTPPRLSPSRF